MMIKNKTILSIFLGTSLLVGGVVGGDALVKTPKEEKEGMAKIVTEKINTKSELYTKGEVSIKQAIGLVNGLYARREKGDEPTKEEWDSAESQIDALRRIKDSPELQKLDRLLETSDAKEDFIQLELNKI